MTDAELLRKAAAVAGRLESDGRNFDAGTIAMVAERLTRLRLERDWLRAAAVGALAGPHSPWIDRPHLEPAEWRELRAAIEGTSKPAS